jgi:osmotically-inducible protein OsmY
MNRNDHLRHGTHGNHPDQERIHDERVRDPYEGQRSVRTYGEGIPPRWDPSPSDDFAREGLSRDQFRPSGMYQPRHASSSWEEQPARYGGGYRDDEPGSAPPSAAGPGRRERGYWQASAADDTDHYGRGQSNSGYRMSDLSERGHEEGHTGRGPYSSRDFDRSAPYDAAGRSYYGGQEGRADTYGSAGYRQQGKRYWFDESGNDQGRAASYRGVGPRGYVRSDERLRELICERLTEAELDASDMDVQVNEGTVTLEGSVPDRRTRHQAEDLVDECGGVKDIQNHLRVRGSDAHVQPHDTASLATAGGGQGAQPVAGAEDSGAPAGAGPSTADVAPRKH